MVGPSRHLNHETIKYKDLVGTGKKQISFDYVNIDLATKYAAEDALITLKLYNVLKPRLIKEKISYIYEKIDKPFRLQLDFFSDFSVKNTPLLIPFQEIQSRVRSYGRFTIPNYDVEYVFLLMRRIWKNDFNSEIF